MCASLSIHTYIHTYIYIYIYYTSEHLLVYTNSATANASLKSCHNPRQSHSLSTFVKRICSPKCTRQSLFVEVRSSELISRSSFVGVRSSQNVRPSYEWKRRTEKRSGTDERKRRTEQTNRKDKRTKENDDRKRRTAKCTGYSCKTAVRRKV